MTSKHAAIRKLQLEMRELQKTPVDGTLLAFDEENLLCWKVALFGPPDTPYAGGYFKVNPFSKYCSNTPYFPTENYTSIIY